MSSGRKLTLEDLFGELKVNDNKPENQNVVQTKVQGFRKQKEFGARKRIKP
jgi:hypothetical protein